MKALYCCLYRQYCPEAYADFRDCVLEDAACEFARVGSFAALAVLFNYHPYSLVPHLLEILDCLPDTVPPGELADLLQGLLGLSEPPAVYRPPDTLETEETVSYVAESGDLGSLLATEHVARLYIGWRPPSSAQVREMLFQQFLLHPPLACLLRCSCVHLASQIPCPETMESSSKEGQFVFRKGS